MPACGNELIRRIWRAVLRGLLALSALNLALPAFAEWAPKETIQGHETYIYTPSKPMASQKYGLLVVLHGCTQPADDLVRFGNLNEAADAQGLVVAVPYVGADDAWGPKCWEYDRGDGGRGHVREITDLTRTISQRLGDKLDRNHVYVAGLSSGAGLSLLLGCAAPDVFAGVGAIAGPSVGSDQKLATVDAKEIPSDVVPNAIQKCEELAGPNRALLQTQITNIAYGDMDRNGSQGKYEYPAFPSLSWFTWWKRYPGQYMVVSVEWSNRNVEALKQLYKTGDLGTATQVQGDRGTERSASMPNDNRARLALLEVHGVGHAWPAGEGRPKGSGGDFVAQAGLNYPAYITEWFVSHNMRAGK